jgi:hypothetical protein
MKNKKQIKVEREWLETLIDNSDFDTFATLTFKTEIDAKNTQHALHRFWLKLDKGYFGAATKNGKRIQRVCVIHKGGTHGTRFTNRHIHFIAKSPSYDLTEFKRAIEHTWKYAYFETGYINDIQLIRKGKASEARLRDYLLHEFDRRDEQGQLNGIEELPLFDLVVYDSSKEYTQITNNYQQEFKGGWLKTKKRKKSRRTPVLSNGNKNTPKNGVVKKYTQQELKEFSDTLQVV